MRVMKSVLAIIMIVAGGYYVITELINPTDSISVQKILDTKEISINTKPEPNEVNPITGLEGDLYSWIGKKTSSLQSTLGNPDRKDLSSYGYIWWVYTNGINQYIQFGIKDDKIVTLFATGDNLSTEPISIGQAYKEINELFRFKKEVTFSNYRFLLTDEDVKVRPISQIDDNLFVQFYFDTFTEKLSSLRVLNTETLLLQRPYEIYYRGELPQAPLLTDKEWMEVQEGMEKQIFEITNIVRTRFEKNILEWDNAVANVAFEHSKDMAINNYFSHYTLDGEGLKERLKEGDVYYFSAGENIAAQYTDGPAAVEGWLNSEGHRHALLKDNYTHLGVGVYEYYYTQNFLQKQ